MQNTNKGLVFVVLQNNLFGVEMVFQIQNFELTHWFFYLMHITLTRRTGYSAKKNTKRVLYFLSLGMETAK